MNSVSFEIPGEPIGQGRPRAAVINGKPRLYTPKKSSDWRATAQWWMKKAMGSERPWIGPVELHIVAYFKPAQALVKKWEKNPHLVVRPAKKPDLDNAAKAVCDAANSIMFVDDAQVVHLVVQKYYATDGNPRVFIKARELP